MDESDVVTEVKLKNVQKIRGNLEKIEVKAQYHSSNSFQLIHTPHHHSTTPPPLPFHREKRERWAINDEFA